MARMTTRAESPVAGRGWRTTAGSRLRPARRRHRRPRCGGRATARCSALRDGSTAPRRRSRSSRGEMRNAAARGPASMCGAPSSAPPGTSPASPSGRFRNTGTSRVAPGVTVEQRVEPLAPRRLLRAGRPLPAALVAADDGDSGARRRRARRHRRVPAARTGRHGRGARGGRQPAVPGRRRACDRRARVRHRTRCRASTRSSARATATWRRPRPRCPPTAPSTSMPGRPRSSSLRARAAQAPEWIAADLVAQAEHDPDARSIFVTWSRRAGRARRAPVAARSAGPRDRRAVAGRPRRHRRCRRRRRGHAAGEPHCPGAPGRRARGACAAADQRRRGVRRAVQRAGGRRLRHRLEPRAADRGRRAIPRRPERRRFRPRHGRAAPEPRRTRATWRRRLSACQRGGPAGPRRIHPWCAGRA